MPHVCFFIFADETEGELWIGREGHFHHIHSGPHKVLVDKKDILVDVFFAGQEVDQAKQIETLRQQIAWFWHDLSHFIKAMGRGQLWFAYGQLEVIRRVCVNLARLKNDFSDAEVGEEPHFKVEQALPVKALSPLRETYCPMEYEAMLQAAHVIFRFYQSVAPALAKSYGITYPVDLERIMINQLEKLGDLGSR